MDSSASGTSTAEELAAERPAIDPWPLRSSASRTELDPISFLTRSARLHPDRTAVVHGERRRTYAELEARVNRLASALRARGLERRDRVAVLSPNMPAMLEAHFGVPAAGGVLVAINTRLSARRGRYILEHSGARFLFVDAELAALVERLDPPASTSSASTTPAAPDDPYEELPRRRVARGRAERWLEDEDEPISINYTSGTTGRPKGVMYTHRGAYLNALGEVHRDAARPATRVYLWTLPMFHCNGWCFPWAVDRRRRHARLPARRSIPARIWELLRRGGRHALLRRADRADRRSSTTRRGATALEPRHRDRRRRAALADAARAHGASSTSASSTSTG